ncbi:17553_t:CDS:1, partial [Gigaspora rosea]
REEVPELDAVVALLDFFGEARELPGSFEGELPSDFTGKFLGVGEFLVVREFLVIGEFLGDGNF